jgi:hypothetical protein
MLLLQNLSQRFRPAVVRANHRIENSYSSSSGGFRPAVVRANHRIGNSYSSSSSGYCFKHEFVPRFAASVAATTVTVVVFAFTISRYQASVKQQMRLDAIAEANFQQVTIRIDEALGNIVAKQTRHMIVLNNLARHCCNAPLGEILKSQDAYRKLVPKLACESVQRINMSLSEETYDELTTIDDIYGNYNAILVAWNHLNDDQRERYLRGLYPDYEAFATLSIAPTTFCMLAVIIPVKTASKHNRGVYAPVEQIIEVAVFFSTYLAKHFSTYVPTEEDLRFVLMCVYTVACCASLFCVCA